jgi:hypothetical protein
MLSSDIAAISEATFKKYKTVPRSSHLCNDCCQSVILALMCSIVHHLFKQTQHQGSKLHLKPGGTVKMPGMDPKILWKGNPPNQPTLISLFVSQRLLQLVTFYYLFIQVFSMNFIQWMVVDVFVEQLV